MAKYSKEVIKTNLTEKFERVAVLCCRVVGDDYAVYEINIKNIFEMLNIPSEYESCVKFSNLVGIVYENGNYSISEEIDWERLPRKYHKKLWTFFDACKERLIEIQDRVRESTPLKFAMLG